MLIIKQMEIDELIKKFSDIEHCPIRNVVAHFSSKWAILLLLALGEAETLRFSDLGRIMPDISAKVLSSTLSPPHRAPVSLLFHHGERRNLGANIGRTEPLGTRADVNYLANSRKCANFVAHD